MKSREDWYTVALFSALIFSEEAMMGVDVGDQAPDFTLPNQSGELISLKDFRDKKAVVLFFYPKDFTPICTIESIAFRDHYTIFTDSGAEVIGVSSDSIDSHAGFCATHELPFLLLCDTHNQVRKSYGAQKLMLPGRVTFVIGCDGEIKHRFSAMFNGKRHVEEAMAVISELKTAPAI
jgi:thioredoxin-dependent peroxiredoxin